MIVVVVLMIESTFEVEVGMVTALVAVMVSTVVSLRAWWLWS